MRCGSTLALPSHRSSSIFGTAPLACPRLQKRILAKGVVSGICGHDTSPYDACANTSIGYACTGVQPVFQVWSCQTVAKCNLLQLLKFRASLSNRRNPEYACLPAWLGSSKVYKCPTVVLAAAQHKQTVDGHSVRHVNVRCFSTASPIGFVLHFHPSLGSLSS